MGERLLWVETSLSWREAAVKKEAEAAPGHWHFASGYGARSAV
jgi:hypothetical protein